MSGNGRRPSQIPELDLSKLQEAEQTSVPHQQLAFEQSSTDQQVSRLHFSPCNLKAMVGGPEIPRLNIPAQLSPVSSREWKESPQTDEAQTHQPSTPSILQSAEKIGPVATVKGQTESGGGNQSLPTAFSVNRQLQFEAADGGCSPFSRNVEGQFHEMASGLNSKADQPVGPPAGLYESEKPVQVDETFCQQTLLIGVRAPSPPGQHQCHTSILQFQPSISVESTPELGASDSSALEIMKLQEHNIITGRYMVMNSHQTTPPCEGCLGEYGLCVCNPVRVTSEQADEVLNTYRELSFEATEDGTGTWVGVSRDVLSKAQEQVARAATQDPNRNSFDSCRSWEGRFMVNDKELELVTAPTEDHHRTLVEAFGQPDSSSGFQHSPFIDEKELPDELTETETPLSGEQPRGPIELVAHHSTEKKGFKPTLQMSSEATGFEQTPSHSKRKHPSGGNGVLWALAICLLFVCTFSCCACGYFVGLDWPEQSWQGQIKTHVRNSMMHSATAMDRVLKMYIQKAKMVAEAINSSSIDASAACKVSTRNVDIETESSSIRQTQEETLQLKSESTTQGNATALAISHEDLCQREQVWFMKGLKVMTEDLPWEQPLEVPFH